MDGLTTTVLLDEPCVVVVVDGFLTTVEDEVDGVAPPLTTTVEDEVDGVVEPPFTTTVLELELWVVAGGV